MTNQIRVVHVSSAHPWTDNRIHYRECATLASGGYDVTLIAVESMVNGPRDIVKVIEIPKLPRVRRVVVSTLRAVRAAVASGAQLVHLHDPELVWAIPLLRAMGKVVIYDAHEDLPIQVASKSYVNGLQRPILVGVSHVVVAVARTSSHIVAATETIAERFPHRKTTVIHNYPPLREEEACQLPPHERRPSVAYVGGIGPSRGADVMVAAAGRPEFPDTWTLELVGAMPASLESALSGQAGWGRVNFAGQLPPAEARDLLLRARVGLVLLQDTPAYRDSLSTKMFEYFAAGLPVIASDFPLWRSIVQENDCGTLVDPTSPRAVAEAVRRYAEDPELLAHHSASARRLAVESFNWTQEGRALMQVYSRLVRA